MKAVVVGLGYVGLPLAIKLSLSKFNVVAIDINSAKIDSLKKGILPFAKEEPNLKSYFNQTRKYKNISYTTTWNEINTAEVIFVCVDTPIAHKKPSFGSLLSAIGNIAKHLSDGQVIILESTLSPGTTERLIIPLIEKVSKAKLNHDFFVAVAPERIRPNYIFKQLSTLPRFIGISSPKITKKINHIYSKITTGDIDVTNILTAEVAKTVENSYRDVQIAFANEIALACEEIGVNVWEIRKLVNKDPYKNIHSPGAGVGGHCIPKDPWLLASSVPKSKMALVKNARKINDSMPNHVLKLIEVALSSNGVNISKAKLAILGYAFVEDSDDTRSSPTQALIAELDKKKIEYQIHDPHVAAYNGSKLEVVVKGADCLVLMVAHSTYKSLNLSKLSTLMRTKIVIDGRNFVNKKTAVSAGFTYKGIGNV